MCGRMRCTLASFQAARLAGVDVLRIRGAGQYHPSPNFCPGMAAPVVVREKASKAEDGQRGPAEKSVVVMRWGLVPSFTKAEEKPDFFRAFNARSETVETKNMFRRLVNWRRCVVVVDGFFEWHKPSGADKQPYYIYRTDGEPIKFAGLYDCWKGGAKDDGEEGMYTFTILTTDVCPSLTWLHNRMPVMLRSDADVEKWLDTTIKAEELIPLLREPKDVEGLVWHPVTRKMGHMKYQEDDTHIEIELKPQGPKTTLHTFFKPGGSSVSSLATPVKKQAPDGGSATPLSSPVGTSAVGTPAKEDPSASAMKQQQHDEDDGVDLVEANTDEKVEADDSASGAPHEPPTADPSTCAAESQPPSSSMKTPPASPQKKRPRSSPPRKQTTATGSTPKKTPPQTSKRKSGDETPASSSTDKKQRTLTSFFNKPM